jgi:thiosulfate reductase cytochrome b subunit
MGKMSWMNIVLLLHSLLFFLSSSITSLVFFSTSDLVLAHWVSVIILANCSLNFYVYCLSGKEFRQELKRIAKRYIRHIHKAFMRTGHQHERRRSPTQNGKNNIYQPVVHQTKQRNCLAPPCMRPYPIRQVMKDVE